MAERRLATLYARRPLVLFIKDPGQSSRTSTRSDTNVNGLPSSTGSVKLRHLRPPSGNLVLSITFIVISRICCPSCCSLPCPVPLVRRRQQPTAAPRRHRRRSNRPQDPQLAPGDAEDLQERVASLPV